MAYGSAKYLNYYRALYLIYFGVAILYIAVWASIADQCKGVCPVASVTDLTTMVDYEKRAGYDETYLLPSIVWPFEQNSSNPKHVVKTAKNRLDLADCIGDARCSDTPLPGVYTHYFSCNLTEQLGPFWYDNVSATDQWKAASTAGKGQTELASNQNYWGKNRPYRWDPNYPSKCYICCDKAYMAEKSICRPSITSVDVYTFCKTSSECASGFKPAAEFPVPQVMIWATFQGDVLLYLGIAYAVVGFVSSIVACGYSVYSGKYELDFKEDNLTLSDK